MSWNTSRGFSTPRPWRLLTVLLLALAPAASFALTALPFVPVRQQLTNEIAVLSTVEDPSPVQRNRLRALNRANAVFANSALTDGRALRQLNLNLRRYPEYTFALDSVATNIVTILTNEYAFVGLLMEELPPGPKVPAIVAKYVALTSAVAKVTATVNATKTSSLYDLVKRRLDGIFLLANEALLIPFPSDLQANQLEVFINGARLSASATSASENFFQATKTDTNISIVISAIDFPRGILFTIPNVQPGTFRYEVPETVTFTNRTDVYRPTESAAAATNGVFFIGTTPNEAYGAFECTGPDFRVLHGRFRVTLSTQP